LLAQFSLFLYESCIVHQVAQDTSPRLPSGSPQGARLRDQQDQSPLQSTPGIINKPYISAVKAKIHPEVYPACFQDVSTGKQFLTETTVKSRRKEMINGLEYHVFVQDITSDSHPIFTGQKRFVDTAGRVEKFQSKFLRRRA
jgi:large subunit ribosomal protein L31